MGYCRNCCVLLFKLGCQFKDHIKFVILLQVTVTLPLITCYFFFKYKFTVLMNCSVLYCFISLVALTSDVAFCLVETDVSCFSPVLKKWRSGKCVGFSLVLKNIK